MSVSSTKTDLRRLAKSNLERVREVTVNKVEAMVVVNNIKTSVWVNAWAY